jgi:hypothetical protein
LIYPGGNVLEAQTKVTLPLNIEHKNRLTSVMITGFIADIGRLLEEEVS